MCLACNHAYIASACPVELGEKYGLALMLLLGWAEAHPDVSARVVPMLLRKPCVLFARRWSCFSFTMWSPPAATPA